MSTVEAIRSFNRFYTRRIGLLSEHLPASEATLAEARVIYEVAQRDQAAAELSRSLGMDPAHLSRIVARLAGRGLLTRAADPAHGRRSILSLTTAGRAAFAAMEAGTRAQLRAMLEPVGTLGERRLVAAMAEISRILDAATAPGTTAGRSKDETVTGHGFAVLTPAGADPDAAPVAPTVGGVAAAAVSEHGPDQRRGQPPSIRRIKVGDLGLIVRRQGLLYHEEYGFDWTYEGLVAEIVGGFARRDDRAREGGWVAEVDGAIVGSVFLMAGDAADVGKLRLLYVEPSARGQGVGRMLVAHCIAAARAAGYARLTLWTNDILVAARRIYEAAGFTLEAEAPHRSFGVDLVGQTWGLDLSR